MLPRHAFFVVLLLQSVIIFSDAAESEARATNRLSDRQMSFNFEQLSSQGTASNTLSSQSPMQKSDGQFYIFDERAPGSVKTKHHKQGSVDCEVCHRWISATVNWLPDEFTIGHLDQALRLSCNDTWIVHFTDFVLTRMETSEKLPPVPPKKSKNYKDKCIKMVEEDDKKIALTTLYEFWETMYEKGGLPEATCYRLGYCPKVLTDMDVTEKWYGRNRYPTLPIFLPRGLDGSEAPPDIPNESFWLSKREQAGQPL